MCKDYSKEPSRKQELESWKCWAEILDAAHQGETECRFSSLVMLEGHGKDVNLSTRITEGCSLVIETVSLELGIHYN